MNRLKDPKFWTVLIGVLVSVGILELSEAEVAEVVQAIMVVVGTIGLAVAWAIEQFGEKRADAETRAGLIRSIEDTRLLDLETRIYKLEEARQREEDNAHG